MGFFSKFMKDIGIGGEVDDDYDDEGYFDDEDGPDERPVRSYSPVRREESFRESMREEEPQDIRPRVFAPRPKVSSIKKGMGVSLLRPASIEDAKEVCELLHEGNAVLMNMEGVHASTVQRIIDFVYGITIGMDGNLQKVSNYVFVASPQYVDLSGEFQDLLDTAGLNMNNSNMRM